jgi:hypothetical protein
VETIIVMEGLSDSLSKPVVSFTARPTTTISMVGRRPPASTDAVTMCVEERLSTGIVWPTTCVWGWPQLSLWATVHGRQSAK